MVRQQCVLSFLSFERDSRADGTKNERKEGKGGQKTWEIWKDEQWKGADIVIGYPRPSDTGRPDIEAKIAEKSSVSKWPYLPVKTCWENMDRSERVRLGPKRRPGQE